MQLGHNYQQSPISASYIHLYISVHAGGRRGSCIMLIIRPYITGKVPIMLRPYNIPWFNFANLSPRRLNGPNFGFVGWLALFTPPPRPFRPFAVQPSRESRGRGGGGGLHAFFGREGFLIRDGRCEHVGVVGILARRKASRYEGPVIFYYSKLRKLDGFNIPTEGARPAPMCRLRPAGRLTSSPHVTHDSRAIFPPQGRTPRDHLFSFWI